MPRIPRRWKGDEEAAPPEEQSAVPSGDPLTSPDGPDAPAPAAPTPDATPAPAGDGAPSPDPVDAPAPAGDGAPSPDRVDAPAQAAGTTPSPEPVAVEATSDASPVEPPSPDPPTVHEVAVGTPSPEAQTNDSPTTEQPTVAAPAVGMTSGDPLGGGATPAPEGEQVAPQGEAVVEEAPVDARPKFRERTRMRRRLRYLRRLRELAFRDLGGLVFDLHRFGRDRNDLVAAKLEALGNIDRELRTLQDALRERREFTDLREAGIAACPRCGTLHDTDANFCPGCGTSLRTAIVRDAAPVTVTPADEPSPPAAGADQPEQQPTTTGP